MNSTSHIIRIRFILTLFLFAQPLIAGPEEDPSDIPLPQFAKELEFHSEWWPDFVSVPQEYTFPDVPPIRAGQRAVLIRIEGSQVILDFGRSGVHRFKLEETDVISRAFHLSRLPPRKIGLFTATFYNKFFLPSDPKNRQCLIGDFDAFDYFLLVYTHLDGKLESSLLEIINNTLDHWPKALPKPGVLVIPSGTMSEAGLLAACKDNKVKWPVMFNFLTRGYRKVLHHQLDDQTTLPLIDKNGRVLSIWTEKRPQHLSEYLSGISDSIENNIDWHAKH